MPSNGEKKSQQILINVAPALFRDLSDIATADDRPLGYVARELMIRGLALYQKDGRLRDSEQVVNGKVVGTISSDAAERERIRRELEKPVGVPMLRQSAKLTPIPKKGELRSDEDKTAGSERPARGRRARK